MAHEIEEREGGAGRVAALRLKSFIKIKLKGTKPSKINVKGTHHPKVDLKGTSS